MKLYEIADLFEEIMLAGTDRETGVITDDCLNALSDLEIDFKEKAINTALYLKGEMAEGEACAKEAKRLLARADSHKNRAARLKDWLGEQVERTLGHVTISDPRGEIKWRNSSSVRIDANAELPEQFLRVTTAPDKKAIGDTLKAGGTVPGCQIVETKNIQIK